VGLRASMVAYLCRYSKPGLLARSLIIMVKSSKDIHIAVCGSTKNYNRRGRMSLYLVRMKLQYKNIGYLN
jgi:hypothetical protein